MYDSLLKQRLYNFLALDVLFTTYICHLSLAKDTPEVWWISNKDFLRCTVFWGLWKESYNWNRTWKSVIHNNLNLIVCKGLLATNHLHYIYNLHSFIHKLMMKMLNIVMIQFICYNWNKWFNKLLFNYNLLHLLLLTNKLSNWCQYWNVHDY